MEKDSETNEWETGQITERIQPWERWDDEIEVEADDDSALADPREHAA